MSAWWRDRSFVLARLRRLESWVLGLYGAIGPGSYVDLVSGDVHQVQLAERSFRCSSLTSAVLVELSTSKYVGETHYVTSLFFAGGNVTQIQGIGGALCTPIGGLAVSGGTGAGPFAVPNGQTVMCVWSGGEWLLF